MHDIVCLNLTPETILQTKLMFAMLENCKFFRLDFIV